MLLLFGLRVELVRDTAVEEGRDERDDLERVEAVEGAIETRRETAGEGGAGRLGVRSSGGPDKVDGDGGA